MASVALPRSGRIYLDTVTIIYALELPLFWPALKPLWEGAALRSLELLTSELTLLESLVAPLREANRARVAAYEQLIQSSELHAHPVSREVLREAAALRAAIPGLRTPDAIHAATAILTSCTAFVTNDAGFKRIPALSVILLNDVLAE